MKYLNIICLFSLLLVGCISDDPKTLTVSLSYLDEFDALTRKEAQGNEPKDKTLNYRAGIVRPTNPKEVVIDEITKAEVVKDEYLVLLSPDLSVQKFARKLTDLKIIGAIVGWVPTFNIVQLEIPQSTQEEIAKIRKIEGVISCSAHHIEKAQLTNAESQANRTWFLNDFNIPLAQKSNKGSGVTIALIDTGIDTALPAFAGRIKNPYSVVSRGENFEDKVFTLKGSTERVVDHGTMVAWMAAGAQTNVLYGSGIAPEANIMPIQVFGYSLLNDKIITNDLMIIEGIARAIAYGAQVINLSLGTDYSRFLKPGDPPLQAGSAKLEQIKQISSDNQVVIEPVLKAARERGIMVVCAAGNDGQIDAKIQPFVASSLTVAVGAIDRQSAIAGFSNRGDVIACYAPGADLILQSSGGNWRSINGTSFSAPFVSGVLAIAKSLDPKLRPFQAIQALKKSNIEGKLSILVGKSSPVFYPIGLLKTLGLKIEESDSTASKIMQFTSLYKEFFLELKDPPEIVVDKVLGFLARRGTIDTNLINSQELQEISKRFPAMVDYTTSKLFQNNSYYASLALAIGNLNEKQLEAISNRLLESDLAAIPLNFHNYRKSLPQLHKRLLEVPKEFNANTIYAIEKYQDPSSPAVLLSYLKLLDDSYYRYQYGEALACNALKFFPKELENAEVKKQILHSFERMTQVETKKNMKYISGEIVEDHLNIDEVILKFEAKTAMNDLLALAKRWVEERNNTQISDYTKQYNWLLAWQDSYDKIVKLINPELPYDYKLYQSDNYESQIAAFDKIGTWLKESSN